MSYTEFSSNHARHVLQSNEEPYYLLEEGATINVVNNIVYSVLHNTLSFTDNLEEICWFQFVSKRGNLDKDVKEGKKLNFNISLSNIKFIVPPHQFTFLTSRNCSWLTNTAFQTTPSCIVYRKIIKSSATPASKDEMKTVPSRLCYCLNTTFYDCTE